MTRFHVQRSIQIAATAEQVFETVADFGTWTRWSPWLCADAEAQVHVSDAASSVGSIYSWNGEIVGQAEIEHQHLESGRMIEGELRCIKPFRSRSKVRFELESVGEETVITWMMHGSLPWFMFWMRAQMEQFVGMDYERGLKMLKDWIETGQVLSKTNVRGVETIGPLRIAGIRDTCEMNDVGHSMEAALGKTVEALSRHGLPTEGDAISVYHRMDMKLRTFDYTSGFIIPDSSDPVPSELVSWSIPAIKALVVEHIGSYDNLGNAWSAAYQYLRYKKLKSSKAAPFEIYRNEPKRTAASDLRTEIFVPLK